MIDFILSQNIASVDAINQWIVEHGINESQHHRIHTFLTNPESFYNRYCHSLVKFATREKRFLDFETPNRVQITHEYDINLASDFKYEHYYYLFNPYNRLGWLKIYQASDRLTIAKSDIVKGIVEEALKPELNLFDNPSQVFDELWNLKKGLPCFIKLNPCGNLDFILSIVYYESIKRTSQSIFNRLRSWLNPIKERRIRYSYLPLENSSSWLYIKAPEHFIVKYKGTDKNLDTTSIDDETALEDSDPDPEKISLTIINKENPSKDVPVINFEIKVPLSLKIWYWMIYILSLVVMCLSLCSCVNRAFLKYFGPIFYTEFNPDFLSNDEFGGILFATIAAIIATRGWLIHEETILQNFAKQESLVLGITVVAYLIGILI